MLKKLKQIEFKYLALVQEKTHYLIADLLNQKLPLPNLREKKNFNPTDDADYRTLLADYQEQYGETLPEAEQVAHEITYEYLLMVIKMIDRPRKAAKKKMVKKTKKPVSPSRKAKTQTKSKNTLVYYQCMCHQSQKGSQPKKITQVAHECKHNALTINAKMSAQKAQAAKKIKVGYETMGQGLAELIAATIFAGYTIKLRTRQLILEQKNGKEQAQLNKLQAEIQALKEKNHA
ncbi:11909_t:CDS:2 [Entrophospora sp. SA101]|nr:11909_t:CDS:2 [Entrophospora sp. SA101]